MHFNNPERIKVFLKDPEKKNPFRICYEVLVLLLTKKELPMYYFKHLYRKENKNYKDYLGTEEAGKIHSSKKLHRQEFVCLLRNKLNFALYCEKNGIATPKLISHNFGRNFFFNQNFEKISDKKDMINFFKEVFKTTGSKSLFMRPFALNGGRGCFRLDRDDLEQKIDIEYGHMIEGGYTHTEIVTQHDLINAIHAKSINTIRILTFRDDGKIHALPVFLRVGIGESVVDNAASGGIFIGINQETGTLKPLAYRSMKFGGERILRHPDSGFRFEGFQIPFFREACEMAVTATNHIPDVFIGWDIAITPEGPTIIEGNDRPDMFGSDVAYGGILQNPVIRKVLSQA